jgi:hypothetical protein
MSSANDNATVAQTLKQPHGMVVNGFPVSRVNVLQVGNECAPPPRPGSDEPGN